MTNLQVFIELCCTRACVPGHRILAGNKRYTRRRRRLIVRAIKCICIPPADGRGLIRRKAWQLLQRDEFNRGVNRTFPPTVSARAVDRAEAWPRVVWRRVVTRDEKWQIANDRVFCGRSVCLESQGLRESSSGRSFKGARRGTQKPPFSFIIFHPSTFYFLRFARKSSRSCFTHANFFLVFYFFLLCYNKLAL